jgi:DNA polymerase III epsilon subunit-like protein
MTAWWQERMTTLDLETTAPEPEVARIVTAAVALCGGGEPTETRTWLADPGVEIPEGAAEIHGVTTERARAEGRALGEVVAEVLAALVARPAGALVVFNATYDLTVLDRECRRLGLPPLTAGPGRLLVVDPLRIEKWLDRFRKTKDTGSRKLAGMCEHYAKRWAAATGKPVPEVLEGAHDAAFDAIAAARLAWLIRSMPADCAVVREPRNYGGHYRHDVAERAAMIEQWAAVKDDLAALHDWTAAEAEAERRRFAAYKRSKGDNEIADRVDAERGWPVLEVMAHKEFAAADREAA